MALKHITFFYTLFEGYKCNKLYEIKKRKKRKEKKEKKRKGSYRSLRKQTSIKLQISQNEILHMKIKACIRCVRVLNKTQRSFIRSSTRLSSPYLRRVLSKNRCSGLFLGKKRLILGEMCKGSLRLIDWDATYVRRVLFFLLQMALRIFLEGF